MQTILMSIHPKWCEKIFNGEKTIEVRKTAPKPPFKVLIYCTKAKNTLYRTANGNYAMAGYEVKGDIITLYCEKEMTLTKFNGKVIGEFICDKVDTISVHNDTVYSVNNLFANKLKNMCLTVAELKEYLGAKNNGYALEITAPVLYDEPKELGEFYRADMEMLIDKFESIGCGETRCEFAHNNSILGDDGFCDYGNCPKLRVTHAPQSYMRIEEDTI